MSSSLSPEIIKDKILENFLEYQDIFIQFQSNFFSGLYKRYQGMENGSLALYFAKFAHQDILRQKDYDLNFNIGFEKFWENHKLTSPIKKTIVNISKDASLPKETARRKILQLVKQKVLIKKDKNIGWFPNEQYKKNYNLIVQNEIKELSSLLYYVSKKMKFSISKDIAERELKEKFNFYWFHFLNTQLKYLKLWSAQLKDLELILIGLQVTSIFALRAKKNNLSHEKIYNNPSVIKKFTDASISATSISEVTGIPRVTCIRKLGSLIKLKMIAQDNISKRYYLLPTSISKDLISKNVTQEVTKIFSEFYFICIRALTVKPLN
jgi:hypothetical protein